jgi:RNA polymerase sigma-70 factor (ECF subfamily)
VSFESESPTSDDTFVAALIANQRRLYAHIARMVPERSDAEDLFQKALLTAWQERRRYDAARDFFPWICGIARNHVLHYFRAYQKSDRLLDPTVIDQLMMRLVEEDANFRRREEALADCLEKLPAKQRRIVEGYYGGDRTIKDYARECGLAVEALYKQLQRTRAALRRCISETLAAEGCR